MRFLILRAFSTSCNLPPQLRPEGVAKNNQSDIDFWGPFLVFMDAVLKQMDRLGSGLQLVS